ncbi:MAG: GGDEF domain-containing phosphodiesterase [Clostridia bacterium]
MNKDLSFFEIHSNDCPNPCCYIDATNYKLLYINHVMSKLTHQILDYDDKFCYEVIHRRSTPCEHCVLGGTNDEKFNEVKIQSEINGKSYRVQSRLFHIDGSEVYYCKYFSERKNNYRLTYNNHLPTGMTIEEAMSECTKIISNDDIESTYNSYIDILGKYYCCDNVTIFNLDSSTDSISARNTWTVDDNIEILPNLENDDRVSLIAEMIEKYEVMGISIFENKKITKLDNAILKEFLERRKIDNLVISQIRDRTNTIIGFVALFNIKATVNEFRLFNSIKKFIQDNIKNEAKDLEINTLLDKDILTEFYNSNKYVADSQELEKNYKGGLGVVFASINGLGRTNEYFGYEAGDSKIQQASVMLRELFSEDWYRISGTEFICLVKQDDEVEFYNKVESFVRKSNKTNNTVLTLGQIWTPKITKIASLVSEADAIMYINKQAFYSKDNNKYKEITNKLLQDLLFGIENDEFLVYLQPKVNLETGKIKGAEALIRRFDKKNNKMIFPDQFIAKYETNSIIRHVDIFVLETVCKLLQKWDIKDEDFTISVNLSRVTLLENNIVDTFVEICDKYGIDYKYIVVELTERVGIVENHVQSKLVTDFQERGFKLSLDDFGCAYSNIITLVDVVFDEVKIDKSLVDHVLTSKRNNVTVNHIISMVNSMDSKTVTLAEGIETEEQANCLKEFGSPYGQGYFYSRPIPSDEFYEKYIK